MTEPQESEQATEFEQAGENASDSLIGEFLAFLAENKKWWMTPILLVLGLLTVLVIASSSAAAPFIYSLF